MIGGLPEGFSGVVAFKLVETSFTTGHETSSTHLLHYLDGVLHREDGPAMEGANNQWWIYGRQLTEDEFGQWLAKKALNEKLQARLALRHKTKGTKL